LRLSRDTNQLLSVPRLLTLAGLLLALSGGIAANADGATGSTRTAHAPAAHKAPAPPRVICSGTLASPGVLVGTYTGNVAVQGMCDVNAGAATVKGSLTLLSDSGLVAAYGLDDRTGTGESSLTITGNVLVDSGASAILGCEPNKFQCLDQLEGAPSRESHTVIGGSLEAQNPLGVVIHNSAIRGSISETGGGGGATCNEVGIFTVFKSPPYSDYEDSTVGGNLLVSKLNSCWMGLARLKIAGNLSLLRDRLLDPDAIEILSNQIAGNLSCEHDSNVWDSTDYLNTLWPREAKPNTVKGKRVGQCVLASGASDGAPLGPSPF
jgi:hypothetical protein